MNSRINNDIKSNLVHYARRVYSVTRACEIYVSNFPTLRRVPVAALVTVSLAQAVIMEPGFGAAWTCTLPRVEAQYPPVISVAKESDGSDDVSARVVRVTVKQRAVTQPLGPSVSVSTGRGEYIVPTPLCRNDRDVK